MQDLGTTPIPVDLAAADLTALLLVDGQLSRQASSQDEQLRCISKALDGSNTCGARSPGLFDAFGLARQLVRAVNSANYLQHAGHEALCRAAALEARLRTNVGLFLCRSAGWPSGTLAAPLAPGLCAPAVLCGCA